MMYRLLTSILLLLTSFSAFAQDHKHEVGFSAYYDRAGQDYIKFSGLQKQNLMYKNAFSVQLNYNYQFNQLLSLRTGVGYSKRGFAIENMDYSSGYIQIPVHLGLEVYRDKSVQLTSFAGGYVGIPLESDKTIKGNSFSVPVEKKYVDVGLEGGINVAFSLNDVYSISFTPRMQFGLSNIYQDYYYEKRRNIAFSFGVGIIRKI